MTYSLRRIALHKIIDAASVLDRLALSKSTVIEDIRYELINKCKFSDLWPHEQISADQLRMDAYYENIQGLVSPGSVVLDLGTSTGILTIWASRLASAVYAINHSQFLIEITRKFAKGNSIHNIKFCCAHTSAYQPPEAIDILILEQMGAWLANESMIPNLVDMRNRALKAGGRILPNRFSLFVEPVELKDEWHVPFIWDQHAYGVDLSQLRNEAAIRKVITLTESKPVWQLYLETVNPRETPRTVTIRRTIERSGRLDGLAVWFDSGTTEGIWLTTQPSAPQIPWQLSIVRTAPRHFEAGMSVNFKVTPALGGRPEVAIGFRQARSCR